MITIVGLGNPGSEYSKTRHNVGFVIIEHLAAELALVWSSKPKFQAQMAKNDQLTLIKPMSYMNNSGQPVRAILEYFGGAVNDTVEHDTLFVVHDDLDLELGSYKLQYGKGPHGHNGLLSLYQQLGTKQFWHVRVGVDGRAGDRVLPPDVYVLSQFESAEKKVFEQVAEKVTKELLNKCY